MVCPASVAGPVVAAMNMTVSDAAVGFASVLTVEMVVAASMGENTGEAVLPKEPAALPSTQQVSIPLCTRVAVAVPSLVSAPLEGGIQPAANDKDETNDDPAATTVSAADQVEQPMADSALLPATISPPPIVTVLAFLPPVAQPIPWDGADASLPVFPPDSSGRARPVPATVKWAPIVDFHPDEPGTAGRVVDATATRSVPAFDKLTTLPIDPTQLAGLPTTATLAHASPAHAAPLERLFGALADDGAAASHWLDTVMRDVTTMTSKSGNVRFQVEPDGFGRITIERTADRLEIGVADARALAVVEASRPNAISVMQSLGVPVSASSVMLDQSGFRQKGDARPDAQIDVSATDDDKEPVSPKAGRFA